MKVEAHLNAVGQLDLQQEYRHHGVSHHFEIGIVGSPHYGPMEIEISFNCRGDIPILAGHSVHGAFNSNKILASGANSRERGTRLFENLAKFVEQLHLLHRGNRLIAEETQKGLLNSIGRRSNGDGPSAGSHLNNATILQNFHRFADHNPADLETIRQFCLFREARAWSRVFLYDHSLDFGDYLPTEAAVPEATLLHGWLVFILSAKLNIAPSKRYDLKMPDEPAEGVPMVRLQSDEIRVTVLPGIGAKTYDLIDRKTGQNFLWHNPRIAPQAYAVEANFDNYWCGGWDDAFPTCESCTHNGETYPNLGELRSVVWRVEDYDKGEETVRLSAGGPITPVRAEKTLRIRGHTLEMEYSIRNEGHAPIDFIWGTHPAYAIEPGCRIHIPSNSGLVSQANPARLGEPGQLYEWPMLETPYGIVDMSLTPKPGNHNAGHYVMDLRSGWYALEYPHRDSGVLVEFSLTVCPHLWLWLSYGGWRGYYLAAIEPWTSIPVTLSDAVAAGTNRVLERGARFNANVKATVWRGAGGLEKLLASRE
jgi:galactose mutarotase-like enzyme